MVMSQQETRAFSSAQPLPKVQSEINVSGDGANQPCSLSIKTLHLTHSFQGDHAGVSTAIIWLTYVSLVLYP